MRQKISKSCSSASWSCMHRELYCWIWTIRSHLRWLAEADAGAACLLATTSCVNMNTWTAASASSASCSSHELFLTLHSAEAIIVPHRIISSWYRYTGRWWVGCYIRYSDEGTGRGGSPPRPLLVVPNVTSQPSMASVPITVLLYNGPLLCGFNVPVKG